MTNRERVMRAIRSKYGRADVIAVPRAFLDVMGSWPAAVFLAQVLFWSERARPDGWFYKSYAEWRAEIHLSEFQVRRAARLCRKLGILESVVRKAAGKPTVHYRLDVDRLAEMVSTTEEALKSRVAGEVEGMAEAPFPEASHDDQRTGCGDRAARISETSTAGAAETATRAATPVPAEMPAGTTDTASRGRQGGAAACASETRAGGGAVAAAGGPAPAGGPAFVRGREKDPRMPTLADEPAAVSEAMAEYRKRIGPIAFSMHPEMKQRIMQLQTRGRADWWSLALKQAEDNGARYWSYVRAVLDRSMAAGRAPGPVARDAATSTGSAGPRSIGREEHQSPGMVALERFMRSEGLTGFGAHPEERQDAGSRPAGNPVSNPVGGPAGAHAGASRGRRGEPV